MSLSASDIILLGCSPAVGLGLAHLAATWPTRVGIQAPATAYLGGVDAPKNRTWAASRPLRHFGFETASMSILALLIAAISVLLLERGQAWIGAALGWTLLAIGLFDALYLLVPNFLSGSVAAVGLTDCALYAPADLVDRLAGGALGFGVLWGLNRVFVRVRRTSGVGLGDAKLLCGSGLCLGWQLLPMICAVASVLALAQILWRSLQKRSIDSARVVVPFAPHLSVATYIAWVGEHVSAAAVRYFT